MRRLYLVLILLVFLAGCGSDDPPKQKWIPKFQVGEVVMVKITEQKVMVRAVYVDRSYRCRVHNPEAKRYPYINQTFKEYELEKIQ